MDSSLVKTLILYKGFFVLIFVDIEIVYLMFEGFSSYYYNSEILRNSLRNSLL